jgi:PAS domain S-box-containing protein
LTVLLPTIEAEGIGSLAFVPLVVSGKLMGKFMVYHAGPHTFTAHELAIASAIAANVAFAIDQHQAREAQVSAEARERQNDLRYRALLEALPLAVFTTDADGYVTVFNQAAVDLWGRRPELGVDRSDAFWQAFTADGEPLPWEDRPMVRALREGRPVRGEVMIQRPDGVRRFVLAHPTPLHDAQGNLAGAVNVLVDITDQKTLQLALRDAIRSRDDFLGQVSHELRMPLSRIGGHSDLLRRQWESLDRDSRQGSLEEVYAHAARMQRLVENLTVLSQLERGAMPGTEPHLLQRLLEETVKEFRERHPQTMVQLHLVGDLPPVESSASVLDQVVWTLLTNAHKYGPREGPIAVTATASSGWVELLVRDRRRPLAPRDLAHVFDAQFPTPAPADGAGLGLSICKRLIEAQRGEIWGRPHAEDGVEFGIRLRTLAGDFLH